MSEQEELQAIYQQAYEEGFTFVEWAGNIVACIDLRDLEALAEVEGVSVDKMRDELLPQELGVSIDLGVPGRGDNRVECLRDALQEAHKAQEKGYFPRTTIAREKAGLPVDETKPLGTF